MNSEYEKRRKKQIGDQVNILCWIKFPGQIKTQSVILSSLTKDFFPVYNHWGDWLKIYSGKFATMPFILIIAYVVYHNCAIILYGYFPPIDSIIASLAITLPLIFMCQAVWFPDSKLGVRLGKIGYVARIIVLVFPTLAIFGEIEHAEPAALIVYVIMLISTVIVTVSLWRPREEGKKMKKNSYQIGYGKKNHTSWRELNEN